MHPKLIGHPDILIKGTKTVIFIHGCFWHKCPKCYKEPKSKKKYWLPKIEGNVRRDKRNKRLLLKTGYFVVRLWEHQIKNDNIPTSIQELYCKNRRKL